MYTRFYLNGVLTSPNPELHFRFIYLNKIKKMRSKEVF